MIDALVQRLSVSIKHPRIGQQIMATASPDMLVSIDLAVDLADASSPHVQILQNIPSQRLRELVFSELLVCIGIASELRKCHPANSLEFGLGHRLLVGQHVLHAWIMSSRTGTTSPAAQAAAVTFTADYWEWQRRRQQAWLATTRYGDLFTPTHADSTSN